MPVSDGFVRYEKHPVPMSAGSGAVSQSYGPDEIEFIEVAEWWARKFVASVDTNRIKVVPCRGTSMSPTIPDGSLLFVDVRVKSHIGDGIYCIDLDHRLLVKRINIRPKDRVFEVVSDNESGPRTETYPLSEEESMYICGKVVAWLAIQKDK
jgi:phage repressor protein C with HTH and peptisase S24 domain